MKSKFFKLDMKQKHNKSGGYTLKVIEPVGQSKLDNEVFILPNFRCPNTGRFISLYQHNIDSSGNVSPFTCDECGEAHDITLDGWDPQYDKKAGRPWLRKR